MSGGEQQGVAIARAVVKRPEILLCDEPTGALDAATGRLVLGVLDRVNRDLGTSVAIVTHNAPIAQVADRVVTLADGRIATEHTNAARRAPQARSPGKDPPAQAPSRPLASALPVPDDRPPRRLRDCELRGRSLRRRLDARVARRLLRRGPLRRRLRAPQGRAAPRAQSAARTARRRHGRGTGRGRPSRRPCGQRRASGPTLRVGQRPGRGPPRIGR